MIATVTATEHISTRTFHSQKPLSNKDGTRVSLATLLVFTCHLIRYIKREGSTALEYYTTEILQETSKASDVISILSQIVSRALKSGYIFEPKFYKFDSKSLWYGDWEYLNHMNVCGKPQRVYADCNLGPRKAEILTVVLVEVDDKT